MAFRDKLSALLSCQDSPKKIALSFAVGVFIGMSPLFGLHTVLGLLFALLFRLDKFVTLVGVYVTNPWTIIPIYTLGTWCGAKVLGVHDIIPDINCGIEKEVCHVYSAEHRSGRSIPFKPAEVMECRFLKVEELSRVIETDTSEITPWFNVAFLKGKESGLF